MLRIIALLATVFIFGCAHRSIQAYDPNLVSKPENATIEVFNSTAPTRPFREVGRIDIRSKSHPMEKTLVAAREMGVDGLILKKSSRKGVLAIGIVYTDSLATTTREVEAAPLVDTSAASAGSFR